MMSLGTAVATCFRKYSTFQGRAPRAEYWWFVLATTLVSVPLELVHSTLSWVFDIATLLPTLAVGWRRMHDTGRTGAWNLLPLVGVPFLVMGFGLESEPVIWVGYAVIGFGFLWALVLLIKPGDQGPNEYGDDPYGMGTDPSVFD